MGESPRPPHGEWRDVPGFEHEMRVSSRGWVMQLNVKTGKWMSTWQPASHPVKGFCIFKHRGKHVRVHVLMALAFIGPRPSPSHTVDHVAKYDGDIMRERSDNRIENLRWASKHVQSLNRSKQKPRRDGRRIAVWKVGQEESSAVLFDSSLAAATALGIHCPGIKMVATGKWQQTKGYHIKYADYTNSEIPADEEFRAINGFFVSQYGRLKDGRTGAFIVTPKPTKGIEYAMASKGAGKGNTRAFVFHLLVADAWPEIVGQRPSAEHTIDHRNRDKADNRACNLRWATNSQQSQNQRKAGSNRRLSTSVAVRPPQCSTWMSFESICSAVKAVNADYGTALTQATLSKSLQMRPEGRTLSYGKHKGWSIRAIQTES